MMEHLNPREMTTLGWLIEGKTSLEIASLMGISKSGVAKHMRTLRQKFGTSTSEGVVAQAFRWGVVK
jgi:DNA-binding CsgD family transcriptional regulator